MTTAYKTMTAIQTETLQFVSSAPLVTTTTHELVTAKATADLGMNTVLLGYVTTHATSKDAYNVTTAIRCASHVKTHTSSEQGFASARISADSPINSLRTLESHAIAAPEDLFSIQRPEDATSAVAPVVSTTPKEMRLKDSTTRPAYVRRTAPMANTLIK